MAGREELFERERHKEPVAGWHHVSWLRGIGTSELIRNRCEAVGVCNLADEAGVPCTRAASSAATAASRFVSSTRKPAACATMCSVPPACRFIERSMQSLQSRSAAGPDNERQLDATPSQRRSVSKTKVPTPQNNIQNLNTASSFTQSRIDVHTGRGQRRELIRRGACQIVAPDMGKHAPVKIVSGAGLLLPKCRARWSN